MALVKSRPRILGLSQVAQRVRDIGSARSFYRDFLGFDESFSFSNPDGTLRALLIKIGDRQSVRLIPELDPGLGLLSLLGLETNDADGMRLYLKSCGIAVPDQVQKGRFTAFFFAVRDPSGQTVEFMQFEPESWTIRDLGRHLPATRISARLSHVGIPVPGIDASSHFYRDVLGCAEIWPAAGRLHLRVPDGTDTVELRLTDQEAMTSGAEAVHHLGLVVPDIGAAAKLLRARLRPAGSVLSRWILAEADGTRRLQADDPDGTRIEIVELAV